jgi:outer membrane protein OmpA-like peptidoglycan-associated protein
MSGDKVRELEPIIFSGRHRMKADSRTNRFNIRELPYDAEAAIDPTVVDYSQSTAYEAWMAGATVSLKEDVYACVTRRTSGGSSMLGSLPKEAVMPTGRPAVVFVTPEAEAVKNRNMSGSAFLDFPVGKSVIQTDFRNNFSELSKIRNMIDGLKNDDAIIVNSIMLRGYASPEGSYELNDRLSRERSQALLQYLQGQYPQYAGKFSVTSVAEDWEGLKAIVEKSNISGREKILNIINGMDTPDAKERALKALPEYRTLVDNYFPQLRRVEYKLDYTVRAFTLEESRERIHTNPGQVSLNEMSLVANTYEPGSPEFNEVFDVAVRVFPNDPVANINQAAILLQKGDAAAAAAAHIYLDKYLDNSASWNNAGVMYLLEGDYARARTYFEKVSGTPAGDQNLELLAQWEEYVKEKAEAEGSAN